MARPVLLALMLGVAGLSACGGKDASGPTVVAGAPAGKVSAVQGTVTALRGDVRRPLAAGDVVAGDDVVETGADGRITIVLDHNQVPFSLGPDRSQRVAASPAWAAARGTAVAVTSTDRSGAAGRHAEREAADTLASAPAAMAAPAAPGGPAPAPAPDVPAAMAAPAPAPDMATAPAPKPAKSAPGRRMADDPPPPPPPPPPPDPDPPPPPPGPGGGGEVTNDTLVTETAKGITGGVDRKMIGQGARGEPVRALDARGGGDGTAPATRLVASIESTSVAGGLTADVVVRRVRSRGLVLRECAGDAPPVTRFELTLTVAPTGKVSASAATGGAADVNACLQKQLAGLTFPAVTAATTARLTLELVPR